MVLTGAGVGLALTTLISAGVTALPATRSATGSALVNSGRQIASALGVAILVTLLGNQVTVASVPEFRVGWLVGAIACVVPAAAGLLMLRPLPEVTPAPLAPQPVGGAGA
jgi:hypothetical protein